MKQNRPVKSGVSTRPDRPPRTLKEWAAQKPKRGNKFNAKRTMVDGRWFDSGAEARRYVDLKMAQKVGVIMGLELQPCFTLKADNGGFVGEYRADFCYWQKVGPTHMTAKPVTCLTWIVEDVKGRDTAASRMKRRHLKAQSGIDVQIVKMPRLRKPRRR